MQPIIIDNCKSTHLVSVSHGNTACELAAAVDGCVSAPISSYKTRSVPTSPHGSQPLISDYVLTGNTTRNQHACERKHCRDIRAIQSSSNSLAKIISDLYAHFSFVVGRAVSMGVTCAPMLTIYTTTNRCGKRSRYQRDRP